MLYSGSYKGPIDIMLQVLQQPFKTKMGHDTQHGNDE
jgi:hypothetical protein